MLWGALGSMYLCWFFSSLRPWIGYCFENIHSMVITVMHMRESEQLILFSCLFISNCVIQRHIKREFLFCNENISFRVSNCAELCLGKLAALSRRTLDLYVERFILCFSQIRPFDWIFTKWLQSVQPLGKALKKLNRRFPKSTKMKGKRLCIKKDRLIQANLRKCNHWIHHTFSLRAHEHTHTKRTAMNEQ